MKVEAYFNFVLAFETPQEGLIDVVSMRMLREVGSRSMVSTTGLTNGTGAMDTHEA